MIRRFMSLSPPKPNASPEKIAVSFKDQSLTYAELDERSNQLAHYLIGLEWGLNPSSVFM